MFEDLPVAKAKFNAKLGVDENVGQCDVVVRAPLDNRTDECRRLFDLMVPQRNADWGRTGLYQLAGRLDSR